MSEADSRRTGSVHWRVSGRVQGVGFRWFVQRTASGLGLDGDVRNLPDGDVEIRARGPADRLETLLAEVRRGPAGATVTGVEALGSEAPIGGAGFTIRH